MLRIRLRRTGAKKQPRYRVVVAESRSPRDGAFVEVLGWYNPQADPAQVVVNAEKAAQWIARGAQPSDRVAYLLRQAGVGESVGPDVAAESEPESKPTRRKSAAGARSSRSTTAAATSEVSDVTTASDPITATDSTTSSAAPDTGTTPTDATVPADAPEGADSAESAPA